MNMSTQEQDLQQNKALSIETDANGNAVFTARYIIDPKAAKSGKSMLLVSTHGAETFNHKGVDIQVNLNVYVPMAKYEAGIAQA